MELEKEILKLIENNSQLTAKNLAIMLDESEEKINFIIKQLEQDKVILGYNTIINWEKVDGEGVTAMIDVKVIPQREVGFNSIAERIYRFPEVRSVNLMSGTYDLSVVVFGENMKDVANFVSQKLSTLEHVQSTVTHFILKTYKKDGYLFDEPEEDKRLVVSP
ncbi:Transcriptional regulator, AsnC family [Candidatus Syntrophocurvum alkaliphilum]|uniref:Transcriptional regulator, AsnC family n=1 Tax=Candidatus Syntrophocurvum alkaliphilum TaxID=2293317 RepID=A0A6I6DGX1_9FIRM|nr:Lrp/AsnC family transcriptional regulator [Candidatus Syntrophocurvum alkaliphilum]QGT99563.1 Transcriptional regulator, AsnC family [Candidatus Syntrophocurvum alkaliphilum]